VRISLSAVFAIAFIIMLAVLGHTIWHGPAIVVANLIVSLMTGGKVTG
jgi:hypothetical protein